MSMPAVSVDASQPQRMRRIAVIAALGLVLAVRLLHLSAAMQSPLTYQPGPDEDYYRRFGEAVQHGSGQLSPEFTFMDPAYGYVLGGVFKAVGSNFFAVYTLQCLLDTLTAFGIIVIARLLGRQRAGLYGALLYALTGVAIMFSATLLKEVWVAAFVTWWVAAALKVLPSERKLAWLSFGVYCGIGIALRSTLTLLALLTLLLPVAAGYMGRERLRYPLRNTLLVAAGLVLALMPWSIRNHEAFGGVSPLPHNGGIVLHQIYNEDNPGSAIWVPGFVSYLHPSEIWRGYSAEASRRAGRALRPPEVDRYWKSEAFAFIRGNPGKVLKELGPKLLKFFSATEIPINRSLAEERMFSPVLAWLPAPAAWLLAMGLAGLWWLGRADRRWPIIAAPVLIATLTFAAFFAEDRFRFHVMAILALCCGVWIDAIARETAARRKGRVLALAALAASLAAASVALGRANPPPPVRWDHVVWGYINMGKLDRAQTLAERVIAQQPENGPLLEALGFTAASGRRYAEAAQYYRRAVAVRPQSHVAHYNLAKVYLELGDLVQAAAEADSAMRLHPSPDYEALASRIAEAARHVVPL